MTAPREPSGEPWSVRDVAKKLGWPLRETRDRLKQLHELHGGVLFRESEAKNAKLWVDSETLARIWPRRFGVSLPSALDIRSLLRRLESAEEKAERALLEAEDLRKESKRWTSRR